VQTPETKYFQGQKTDIENKPVLLQGYKEIRCLHGSPELLPKRDFPEVPGIMIAVVAVAVLPVFVTMRETAPRRPRPSST
jgi:hypothetical protein